jgi:acetolactate synthase small subunit
LIEGCVLFGGNNICFYFSKIKEYSKIKDMPKKTVMVGEVNYNVDKDSDIIKLKNIVISAEKGEICKAESTTVMDGMSGSIVDMSETDIECRPMKKGMKISDIMDCMKKGMDMFEKAKKSSKKTSKKKTSKKKESQ